MQIWEFVTNEAGRIEPQCVCDLTRHQSSVSAVRWSPDGKLLASADLGELSNNQLIKANFTEVVISVNLVAGETLLLELWKNTYLRIHTYFMIWFALIEN